MHWWFKARGFHVILNFLFLRLFMYTTKYIIIYLHFFPLASSIWPTGLELFIRALEKHSWLHDSDRACPHYPLEKSLSWSIRVTWLVVSRLGLVQAQCRQLQLLWELVGNVPRKPFCSCFLQSKISVIHIPYSLSLRALEGHQKCSVHMWAFNHVFLILSILRSRSLQSRMFTADRSVSGWIWVLFV